MAAITRNPVGGLLSKITGRAASKATGSGIFKDIGETSRKYGSDPLGNASKDWAKFSGKTDEPVRAVSRPRYTGYSGTGI